MIVFWMIAGLVFGGFYGWLWATVIAPGDTDDRSMAEWQRRQDHFRKGARHDSQ